MADAVSTFTIDLCVGWAKIGEAVAGTFDGVIRDLAVGEWRLSGMVDAVDLQGSYSLADVDTVRVVRDATIVFAGQGAPVAAGGAGGLEPVDAAGGLSPDPAHDPGWAGSVVGARQQGRLPDTVDRPPVGRFSRCPHRPGVDVRRRLRPGQRWGVGYR